MRRKNNALGSTRPHAGLAAVIVALLAVTAAGCNDDGADVSGSSSPDSSTSVTSQSSDEAGLASMDEWCAVVREVGEVLDASTLEGPLDVVQAPQREAIVLIDQLIAAVELVDEEYRDDVLTVIEGQRRLSQAVVDATDTEAMKAEFDKIASEVFVVNEDTYEWIGTTCGLDEAGESTEAANDSPAVEAASHGDISVIVDQSPTVSDIGALGFLAARPDVELLAVTMPGTGESDCARGAVTTRAVLDAAGDVETPIGCGGIPLEGINEWPLAWREAADSLAGIVAPGVEETTFFDADSVIIETLTTAEAPVTIVVLGPLTNIASVLATDPSLADKIEKLVVMGGAVSVPGNVEEAPAAEWNLYADPGAAKAVLESGVPVALVALDATNDVPLTDLYVDGVASIDHPLAAIEAAVLGSLESFDYFYMWDELAAVLTVQPEVATWTEKLIVVDEDGATVESPDGVPVQVAISPDAASVRSLVLGALNELDS